MKSFVEGMDGWFSHKIFPTHRCSTNAIPKSYKKLRQQFDVKQYRTVNIVSVNPARSAGVSLDSHHAAVRWLTSNQHASTCV